MIISHILSVALLLAPASGLADPFSEPEQTVKQEEPAEAEIEPYTPGYYLAVLQHGGWDPPATTRGNMSALIRGITMTCHARWSSYKDAEIFLTHVLVRMRDLLHERGQQAVPVDAWLLGYHYASKDAGDPTCMGADLAFVPRTYRMLRDAAAMKRNQ